ncbi:hypothetical protein ACIGXM_00305 [Kitasatospora sp. NPDC052896]|uniref:hypothetical protein n=1 Tax=Kitasatospora sp. NPDC052896 TaxID=3364061 RepID=UPI0037C90D6C
MSRSDRELEAFIGFCAGLAAMLVGWLAVAGVASIVGAGPDWRHGGYAVIAAGGLGFMVIVSRGLRARPEDRRSDHTGG